MVYLTDWYENVFWHVVEPDVFNIEWGSAGFFKLLFNIKKEEVFIPKNATYLRIVSWCSFAIALITFVGGFFYMPLLFIAMAGFFAGVLLRVVKNVMYSAIELKQDNDLTI